jgi:hypothetical protein
VSFNGIIPVAGDLDLFEKVGILLGYCSLLGI